MLIPGLEYTFLYLLLNAKNRVRRDVGLATEPGPVVRLI